MQQIRSFVGYLEGSGKSLNTIKSYRQDLKVFAEYLRHSRLDLGAVDSTVLKAFAASLTERGYRKNTQRRILITAHRFLRYTLRRKKITAESAVKIPTPHKVERVPKLLPLDLVRSLALAAVAGAPNDELVLRNSVLVLILSETGCLVSEVGAFRFQDLERRGAQWFLELETVKTPRSFEISAPCADLILKLSQRSPALTAPICVSGQGRGGLKASQTPISARGVEWLLKTLARQWKVPGLTARALRQSCAVKWLKTGRSESAVQTLLGLHSDYAFRTYRLLL